ncbi:DUF6478 family protein [Pontivivens insulae]|uniref:Uncharacterized protein n=1 Tax=Pontivivens insulae TaxID=1639689 RepID=A0A2R8ADI9_9RHOB|nr:DUF6478 family protein [Pontivivens insulae]RED14066.1 hypothetical protein DFR53_1418 [Pontivivens insulae]SPF30140.1 hypothetical protein POI8812_02472 [Pontivivens insulae]
MERINRIAGFLVTRLSGWLWTRRTRVLDDVPVLTLRRWRRQAETVGRLVRNVEQAAARRIDASGQDGVGLQAPADASFSFRPAVLSFPQTPTGHVFPMTGTELSAGVALHHDISPAEIIVRQDRGTDGQYPLIIEVWRGTGSFVSLSLALPEAEAHSVTRDDLIRLSYQLEMEQSCEVFARLNLAHGPNTEQVVRAVELRPGHDWLEFDVHFTQFDPTRTREIWIDLIFNTLPLNRIVVHDLIISRRARLSL